MKTVEQTIVCNRHGRDFRAQKPLPKKLSSSEVSSGLVPCSKARMSSLCVRAVDEDDVGVFVGAVYICCSDESGACLSIAVSLGTYVIDSLMGKRTRLRHEFLRMQNRSR